MSNWPEGSCAVDANRLGELRERVRRTVPPSPGVYTWLGACGERLYVGKSNSLRQRMLSYLTPAAARPDARTRNLAFAIDSFEWQETRGELMALLLEDARIKQYEPRYNERQRDYRERMYLLLTDDPYPACLITEADDHQGGSLWGPFKDEYFCRDVKLILSDELGLRACADAVPFRHSARFDLGQCSGPCRAAISTQDYGAIVATARAFLDGDGGALVALLAARMQEASAGFDYERAALLRDRIAFCQRFSARQRFFHQFREGSFTAVDERAQVTLLFERGLLRDLKGPAQEPLLVPPELDGPLSDPRVFLDRANVLYSWQTRANRNSGRS